MLKQTQVQKQTQRLLPKLIQRQNLLMLTTPEMEQAIKNEAEENPFLEIMEDVEDAPAINQEALQHQATQQSERLYEERPTSHLSSDEISRINEYNINKNQTFSLYEVLTEQLRELNLDEKEGLIAQEIIGSLNDDGYLHVSMDELKEDLDLIKAEYGLEDEVFDEREIEKVLKIIQGLEPVGIGSRDLKECLIRQCEEAEVNEKTKNLALQLLKEYFEELTTKKYDKIISEVVTKNHQYTNDDLKRSIEFIQTLNPKPGYSVANTVEDYIYPDLIVSKNQGEYEVSLNRRFSPVLKISDTYKKFYQENKSGLDKEAKEFMVSSYNRAEGLIDAVRSRKETLLKVMSAIVSRQLEFFDSNGEILNPLMEKEIAEDTGLDLSTVSRTVNGKYVQTDFGIFELKKFFNHEFKTGDGDTLNADEVKKKLKEIIETENPKKPYPDEKLAEELSNAGFNISRRTVSKYREMMNIPKASLRKKLVM